MLSFSHTGASIQNNNNNKLVVCATVYAFTHALTDNSMSRIPRRVCFVISSSKFFFLHHKKNLPVASVLDSRLPNWKQFFFFFFRGYVGEDRPDC